MSILSLNDISCLIEYMYTNQLLQFLVGNIALYKENYYLLGMYYNQFLLFLEEVNEINLFI